MISDKWISELDQITHAFKKDFGDLSEAELNQKPNAESWSIAQNIDHLITLNSTYFSVIENAQKNSNKLPWFARFNFISSFFGRILLKAVDPDRARKSKTFSIWEPTKTSYSGDIIPQFEQHQEKLKEVIKNSEKLLQQDAIISSPANKNIIYKLSAAYDIIISHEKRHLNQAREVLEVISN